MDTRVTQATDDVIAELRREHRHYESINLPTLKYPAKYPSPERQQILRELYKEICTSWRTLVDVRFKLLTLVPAASAVILTALFTAKADLSPFIQTGIALFGLFVTLGLSVYDKRNSELHDDLISRARKIEDELGIDTGQFRGRKKPSKKMSLFPHREKHFKLPLKGKFTLQLPEKSSGRLMLHSLDVVSDSRDSLVPRPKKPTLQLPEGSILQVLDDQLDLRLPQDSTLQFPEDRILQVPRGSRLLLFKDLELQLLEISALQLSKNDTLELIKLKLQFPSRFTRRKLKLTLSLSNSNLSSLKLDNPILKLSANSRIRLVGEPPQSETNLPLPNKTILKLPDTSKGPKISVEHGVGTRIIYGTAIIGWLVAIPVIWLIPIMHKLLHL